MTDLHERDELTRAARLFREGLFDDAQALCRKVLKRNKRSHDALQMLGLIAFRNNQFDQAIAHYKQCLVLAPRTAKYHYLLAKVHTIRGDMVQAIKGFDAALAIDPNDRSSIAWKAIVLERQGDHGGARALLEPFVAAGTNDGEMTETWARIELGANRPQQAHAVIDRQLAKPDLAPLQRQVLLFLDARALEQAGANDDAFHAYEKANQSLNAVFDPAAYTTEIDRLLQVFSRENINRLPRAKATAGPVPVFIAGMPRSGTTLIEQIIDAHPQAHGAGEIRHMEEIQRTLPQLIRSSKQYPECVDELKQKDVDQLSRQYLDAVRRLAPQSAVIVNKSLENYKHIGLIALLLPQAKIIHCRRDPLDTCLSCYFSHLMPPRHAYACDLASLGFVYRQYERLMRHWRDVLGETMLDIEYERLVADQPGESRRIIEFCGLGWDERCLRFHDSGRVAMTLSYDQVRRPMYDASIGRARKFERHLEPLKQALADEQERRP